MAISSLRERIEVAKSAADIESLLSEGKKYEFASPKTRLSWQNAAKTRLLAIESLPATVATEPEVKVKKPRAKKSKD